MHKSYLFPIVIFTIALLADLFSYREYPLAQSLDKIDAYVSQSLNVQKDYLLDNNQLQLFAKDSLTNQDFNKIKKIENQLAKQGIQCRLFEGDSLIFWNNIQLTDTLCHTYLHNGFKIELCKAVIDESGNIHNDILKNGLFNQKTSESSPNEHTHISELQGIQDQVIYRPYRLNVILIIFYLLAFLSLIIISLNTNKLGVILSLVIVRLAMIFFEWQDRFQNIELSNALFENFSYCVIDLLIDALIIFGLLNILSSKEIFKKIKSDRISLIVNAIFFILLTVSHIRLIQLLVNGSEVFNSFNDLSLISLNDLLSILAILIIQAGIFVFAYSLFVEIRKKKVSKPWVYASFGMLCLIISYFAEQIHLELNPFVLFVFLIVYILLYDLFVDVKSKNITWIIWWAIFFAAYLSALFFNYDIKKEVSNRHEFIKTIIKEIPEKKINELKSSSILDSISIVIKDLLTLPPEARYDKSDFDSFIMSKFNLEDISVELYRTNGDALFNNSKYNRIKNYLINWDSRIEYDEINNTIWVEDVIDSSYTSRIAFTLESNNQFDFNFNYYKDDQLLYNEIDLSQEELDIVQNSFQEIIYHKSNAYVKYAPGINQVLVSKKSFSGLIKPIALFSLLFCLIVLLSIFISLSHSFFNFLPEEWPFKFQRFDTLNSKIQISLILVILLSFVIIASITNSFMRKYLSAEKDKYFADKIESLANEIQDNIAVAQTSNEAMAIASNYKSKIEHIHNVDLDIFKLQGNKESTDYFTYTFFTKQEYPPPFTDRSNKQLKSYIPIILNGNTIGISSVDHRQTNKDSSYVYDFLGSIFNVYVFLFLIASVIAIFIARSITKPLSILNQKLLQLQLGKENELIDWERDDEIGSLIMNYNKLVNKLEESAQILAKTERDSAWREMAKQVAHEIKNPLTPMKLSIQYLEKAIKQNPEEASAISKKISNTLLEQIDNLTEIANAFSSFAELPQSSNVKIELNEVVELVHNLFRKREDMDIFLSEPIDPLFVYADKNQLIRILNNLVKNAIESIPNTRRGKINLTLESKGDKAIIKVSDNGIGIPFDMRNKIFQPKFTTKDSGSGLGLAICANMIESMNGRIYFDSEPDKGTDFYIELDIIRQSYYQDNDKRITLD